MQITPRWHPKYHDAWKTGPVAFESCWDMRKWKEEGWDIPYIFDYALKYHVSYINNKSARIPEGTRHDIERFLLKMGYRLVLKRIEHNETASRGSLLPVSMIWENTGVAPPYRDYLLALRLVNTKSKESFISVGETSVKGWLPGEIKITESFRLSGELTPGRHEFAIALVDPDTRDPVIQLAIAGRTGDGWYPLSQIEIEE